jgi:hypothetical protein
MTGKATKEEAEAVAGLVDRAAGLANRVNALEDRIDQVCSQADAHDVMLTGKVEKVPELKGLDKEDYPAWVRDNTREEEWVRVTPRTNYLPGININRFTVPCHAGVPTMMPPQFFEEARKRGIV